MHEAEPGRPACPPADAATPGLSAWYTVVIMEDLTPMMKQYHEIKRRYPGKLVFFRLGDFYEMFYEDAVLASRELEITLTARNKDKSGAPIPLCGVP